MSFETIEHNHPASKEEQWKEIEQQVEQTGDRLGLRIDEKIKPTVVALKANGFGTTASCEGHIGRGLPYPWVVVESPLAESLLGNARYEELRKKVHALRKEGERLAPEEGAELSRLIDAQIEANESEYRRLAEILRKFYESQPEGEAQVKLMIRKGPWNQSRIQPEGVDPRRDASREEEEPRGRDDKLQLERYRHEMERFASFLREKFYAGSTIEARKE